MRYAIISDIHANLTAFNAVLDDFDPDSVEEIWCLGDVVGYGPAPNECVERLREFPHRCLVGNHDAAALKRLNVADFNAVARQAILWTQEQLTAENRHYLEERPERIGPLEEDFTLVHGSPRRPVWEYILSPSVALPNFGYFDTAFCLVGHTHVPVIYRQPESGGSVDGIAPPVGEAFSLDNGRMIINPGSVGQPRDGDPRASYAILDVEARTIEHRRLEYPIEETQERMRKAELPPQLISRLDQGW